MIVTGIKAVTKQKFQIELDGQPAFVLYRGELSRYRIEQDKELSPQTYEELVFQVLGKRARLYAMRLLERGDRTEAELYRKLEQKGYPKEAVKEAVAYVKGFHYIDDFRYASGYVGRQRGVKGPARLKMELLQKGVDRETVDRVLEKSREETDAREAVRTLVEKKRRGKGALEKKEKQRLYAFLLRRGFASQDVRAVFRELGEETGFEEF